jgi:hypothetical protein
MNQENAFLTIFVGAVMALAAGCSDDGGGGGGTGGMSGTGGGSGTNVQLVADKGGFIAADTNSLGVQGAWYVYADSLGSNGMPPGACQSVGMHTDAECSKVTKPAPVSPFAPSDETPAQKLCTAGTVEAVLNLNGSPDYSNMWGAGIGLDFNNAGGNKLPFDATAAGVKGVSFKIDVAPVVGMRVEFPDAVTNNKSAAYWEATTSYGPSPVMAGVNTILWDKVKSPSVVDVPPLDPSKLMGIQFHVVSGTAGAYEFCISEMTLLK